MFYTILIITVILAVLLVLLVLAQNSKGGMGSEFGGSASSVMGVQKTTDILEKLTWGFVGAIIVLSLVANKMIDPKDIGKKQKNDNIEAASQRSTTPVIQNNATDAEIVTDTTK